jgi:hypothetical protein
MLAPNQRLLAWLVELQATQTEATAHGIKRIALAISSIAGVWLWVAIWRKVPPVRMHSAAVLKHASQKRQMERD